MDKLKKRLNDIYIRQGVFIYPSRGMAGKSWQLGANRHDRHPVFIAVVVFRVLHATFGLKSDTCLLAVR